jgi:hypothetical protein
LSSERRCSSARGRCPQDALALEVLPEEGVGLHELERAIRDLKIPSLQWAP